MARSKKKLVLKNINDVVPIDVILKASKWVLENCIIFGKTENYVVKNIAAYFPHFEGLDEKSLKSWVENELYEQFSIFNDYDISTLYENTLVQHNNIYESVYSFASEYDLSELKLQILKQREQLLKLVSDDPILYIQKEIGSKLDDDSYDLTRLSSEELIEMHYLISIADEEFANQVAFLSPKLIELYEKPS